MTKLHSKITHSCVELFSGLQQPCQFVYDYAMHFRDQYPRIWKHVWAIGILCPAWEWLTISTTVLVRVRSLFHLQNNTLKYNFKQSEEAKQIWHILKWYQLNDFHGLYNELGASGGVVVRHYATNRQVAGSIPDGVKGFFIDTILPVAQWSWGRLSLEKKQVYLLGVKAACARGWKPYHHPVPLSYNLGTLTSWNPLGDSKPITGLLYLFSFFYIMS